jgi:hypothetical protein
MESYASVVVEQPYLEEYDKFSLRELLWSIIICFIIEATTIANAGHWFEVVWGEMDNEDPGVGESGWYAQGLGASEDCVHGRWREGIINYIFV